MTKRIIAIIALSAITFSLGVATGYHKGYQDTIDACKTVIKSNELKNEANQ